LNPVRKQGLLFGLHGLSVHHDSVGGILPFNAMGRQGIAGHYLLTMPFSIAKAVKAAAL